MEQQRVAHRVVLGELITPVQIFQRGELQVRVCRFLSAHLVIDLESLSCVACLQILTAYDDAQVHVVGRVVAKCLQLHEG